jgi:hypothetical protein
MTALAIFLAVYIVIRNPGILVSLALIAAAALWGDP